MADASAVSTNTLSYMVSFPMLGSRKAVILRRELPEFNRFTIEGVDVLMTHIGGKPGKYSKPAFEELDRQPPKLFICGHSHILLVKMDPRYNMLWMNPGACGIKGFHSVRTLLRFSITGDRIHDLEVIELGKRA